MVQGSLDQACSKTVNLIGSSPTWFS